MTARVTLFDMAAQLGGTAKLNGAHHPALQGAQRVGVNMAVRLAVALEYIRNFELGRAHGRA